MVRSLQQFIGESPWCDSPLLARHWQEVGQTLGEDEGVLIVDGSDFRKQGQESVGMARQWCGELGKKANCQAGVFLAYAGRQGAALGAPGALPAETVGGGLRLGAASASLPSADRCLLPDQAATGSHDGTGSGGPRPPARSLADLRRGLRPGRRLPGHGGRVGPGLLCRGTPQHPDLDRGTGHPCAARPCPRATPDAGVAGAWCAPLPGGEGGGDPTSGDGLAAFDPAARQPRSPAD